MVHWLVGSDSESITILLRNTTLLALTIPHWHDIRLFAQGVIKSMTFSRQQRPKAGHGLVAMKHVYSFDEAHEVVAQITKTFASYWETECQSIKSSVPSKKNQGSGEKSR